MNLEELITPHHFESLFSVGFGSFAPSFLSNIET